MSDRGIIEMEILFSALQDISIGLIIDVYMYVQELDRSNAIHWNDYIWITKANVTQLIAKLFVLFARRQVESQIGCDSIADITKRKCAQWTFFKVLSLAFDNCFLLRKYWWITF